MFQSTLQTLQSFLFRMKLLLGVYLCLFIFIQCFVLTDLVLYEHYSILGERNYEGESRRRVKVLQHSRSGRKGTFTDLSAPSENNQIHCRRKRAHSQYMKNLDVPGSQNCTLHSQVCEKTGEWHIV